MSDEDSFRAWWSMDFQEVKQSKNHVQLETEFLMA